MNQPANSPCQHVCTGSANLTPRLVLDAHLWVTDALLQCDGCDRLYLVEMIDYAGQLAAFRLSNLPLAHAQQTLHNLDRGSCDIRRAGEEIASLAGFATLLPGLVLMHQGALRGYRSVPVAQIPRAHWRQLPCDGRWVTFIQTDAAP